MPFYSHRWCQQKALEAKEGGTYIFIVILLINHPLINVRTEIREKLYT
jgi:hypothetical protein